MTFPTTVEIMLRDPLSEVTRRERRMLLGASILSIFITKTGLIPEKISALGVELARTNQKAFLSIMAFVVLYFIVAFVVYGLSDFFAWRISYSEGVKSIDQTIIDKIDRNARGIEEDQRIIASYPWPYFWLRRFVVPISGIRAVFEFVLPLIIGSYALYVFTLFRCQI